LYGPPPKVVWLAVGNAGTLAIAMLLEAAKGRIQRFVDDPEESLLVLGLADAEAP
jgi:predicted nuclease of predicted toxin-antitoxin system